MDWDKTASLPQLNMSCAPSGALFTARSITFLKRPQQEKVLSGISGIPASCGRSSAKLSVVCYCIFTKSILEPIG
jgi:hypothetical protein